MSRRLPIVVDPRTRAACAYLPRPCPVLKCRYHLTDGAADSCALDVADRDDEPSLEEIGKLIGKLREPGAVSNQQVRIVLERGVRKLRALTFRRVDPFGFEEPPSNDWSGWPDHEAGPRLGPNESAALATAEARLSAWEYVYQTPNGNALERWKRRLARAVAAE
jgi:hypothetical protein